MQIEENVENDQLTIEKYVKELTSVCREMFKATGATFEQEHLRFISMITASRGGGPTEEVTTRPPRKTRSSKT